MLCLTGHLFQTPWDEGKFEIQKRQMHLVLQGKKSQRKSVAMEVFRNREVHLWPGLSFQTRRTAGGAVNFLASSSFAGCSTEDLPWPTSRVVADRV